VVLQKKIELNTNTVGPWSAFRENVETGIQRKGLFTMSSERSGSQCLLVPSYPLCKVHPERDCMSRVA
jgi:hypothetical protein